jgi:hypothetical protein
MRQHGLADRIEVAGEVRLGRGGGLADRRPERLVGVRDCDLANCEAGVVGLRFCVAAFLAVGGSGASVASSSLTTSVGGLSSRMPLKLAWRSEPVPVQPAYSISATARAAPS